MSVYLAYTGMQDMFLTETPEFTHFKTVYVRDQQSTSKIVEQSFDQTSYSTGDTITATLRQNGDYITKISLKVILPKLLTGESGNWKWYTNPVLGSFVYGFDSAGTQVFTVQLNSRTPYTNSTNWYTLSATGVSVSFNLTTQKTTFNTGATSISYLVFSSSETARLFGFINNPIQLFSGFLRFNVNRVSPVSQVTFQECGWLQFGTSASSYTDDVCYKLINSISLFIGKQLIQEFDSNYIQIRKDTDSTYKNRPVLKLLEGDTNTVDFNRVYYFEIPFIKIPLYAIPRHDVQIRLATNPLTNLSTFYTSLVISFSVFSDVTKLPMSYRIPFKQIQYFSRGPDIDVRGPLENIFTNGDPNFEFKLNGERYFGKERAAVDCMRSNFVNISRTSNVVTFDGPINMSRIRDQHWQSSNTNVYAETWNVLGIDNDMAGLLFDYTSVQGGYPRITTSATVPNPSPTPDELYVFDYISETAKNTIAIFSMRRTNIYYTGPVVRLIKSSTLEEDDFYTDSTQSYLRNSSNVSVSVWGAGNTLNIARWYDQSGNGNYMYQQIGNPELSYQDGKYVIFFNNTALALTYTQQWLLIKNPILNVQQCTSIMKPIRPGNSESIVFGMNSYLTVRNDADASERFIAVNSSGRFVSIAYGGNKCLYSDDGIVWYEANLPSTQQWTCIAADPRPSPNGKFVIISNGNKFAYSSDGTSWTEGNMSSSRNWFSLACNPNGMFVAVEYSSGSDTFAYWNGSGSWTEGNLPSSTTYWYSITSRPTDGRFVVVSIDSKSDVVYSDDGISWSVGTLANSQRSVSVTANKKGRFVVISWDNLFQYSDDGVSWTSITSPYNFIFWRTVSASPMSNAFVATGGEGNLYAYSETGTAWTLGDLPSNQIWISSVASPTTGRFVIITKNYTNYAYSDTGKTGWTQSLLKQSLMYMNRSPFTITTNSGTSNNYARLLEWNTVTAYGNTTGGSVSIVSDNAVTHGADCAFYGYMFEMGFFGAGTLSSESSIYYSQRPSGF